MYKILSSEELRKIIAAIENGEKSVSVSFDLGYSGKKEIVGLFNRGFVVDSKEIKVDNIRDDDKSCYLVLDDCLEKAQYVSRDVGGIYRLVPTQARPILQISGTSMHKQSFIERIEKDRLYGNILDAGTGLGYTAIACGKNRAVKKVTTIEIDPMILDIQKINPYSQELFLNKKISLVHGNLTEEVLGFLDGEFSFIILDGGTPRSSEGFFSLRNYEQIFRVLRNGGKLYHYVPNPKVKSGKDFGAHISSFLKKAGFTKIERDKEGSYLVARKMR